MGPESRFSAGREQTCAYGSTNVNATLLAFRYTRFTKRGFETWFQNSYYYGRVTTSLGAVGSANLTPLS